MNTAAAEQITRFLRASGFPLAQHDGAGTIRVEHAAIVTGASWRAHRGLRTWIERAEDVAAGYPTPHDAAAVAWHTDGTGHTPEDWYVTMTGAQFLELLTAYSMTAARYRSSTPADIAHGIAPNPEHRCLAPTPGGICIGPAGHDPAHDGR